MRIVEGSESVQGSQEWREWREALIGASEISAILGISEYQTPYGLWARKKGLFVPSDKPNAAIERGNYFEGYVRAKYELMTGYQLLPLIALHDKHDRISCSFDGIDTKAKVLIEIKIPKQEVIDAARLGVLPPELEKYITEWRMKEFCVGGLVHPTYYVQVQQQLAIAGPEYEAHFLVGVYENVNGKDRIREILKVVVKPDPEIQAYILISALGFIKMIDENIQPPLTDRDVMELTCASSKALFKRLGDAKALFDKSKKKDIKEAFEAIKEEAIEHCEVEAKHTNCLCEGIILKKNKNGVWSVKKK